MQRTSSLRSAGYAIVMASSLKEGINLFTSGDFDLVLLCHSIPDNDRERLTCLIRASGSFTPVVSIVAGSGMHDIFPDATLDESNPDVLLAALREVLIKAEKRLGMQAAGFRSTYSVGAPSQNT